MMETKNDELTMEQMDGMKKLGNTMLYFLIADVVLVLFLTFGMVFPSKVLIRNADEAMPDSFYSDTAKTSPLESPRSLAPQVKGVKVPLLSARSLPLPSQFPTSQPSPAIPSGAPVIPAAFVSAPGNGGTGNGFTNGVSAADREANLTMPKRTT